MIAKLESVGNLTVINQQIDWERLCRLAKLPMDNILALRDAIEQRRPAFKHLRGNEWKLYISVLDRYRDSLVEALDFSGQHVAHFDADTDVRQWLGVLFDMASTKDICIRFKDEPCRLGGVTGSLITLKNNDKVRMFLRAWRHRIDGMPLHKMPRGYGQISFYDTYMSMKRHVSFGNIPDSYFFSVLRKIR